MALTTKIDAWKQKNQEVELIKTFEQGKHKVTLGFATGYLQHGNVAKAVEILRRVSSGPRRALDVQTVCRDTLCAAEGE